MQFIYDDNELIQKYFPLESPRVGQIECIKSILKAFENGKRIVILEAPTGSGKSVIAKTITNLAESSCYITSQILLQEQLVSDFGEAGKFQKGPPLIHLKGRSNYTCVYPSIAQISQKEKEKLQKLNMNCATGVCKRENVSMCSACVGYEVNKFTGENEKSLLKNKCPYWLRTGQFLAADAGLMNFKSFLFQTAFNTHFAGYGKELLIIDECHNTEKELLDFVTLAFDDKLLLKELSMRLPKYNTPQEYAKWFEDEKLVEELHASALIAQAQERFQAAEELDNLSSKVDRFLSSNLDNYVLKLDWGSNNKRIELKPIFVRNEAQRLLLNKADFVLMMSATVLSADIMCDSLGIDKKDVTFIKLPSSFPIENRKIHYMPAGSMSYKSKDATLPKMVKVINEICNMHEGQKGIIHTHNFQIAEFIMNNASSSIKHRLLFQKNFKSRDELLAFHKESLDTIIVAPAMHEGVDLKDDLSRFQIICKMPYPNFVDDPQLSARMKLSQGYYDLITCLKLVQSYGRSIRSETDYAETYILDSDFDRLVGNCGYLLPDWFKEAIV